MATNPVAKAKLPAKMTPLWVISLFLSLTEVIAGIAATQTTDSLRTAFVW